MDVLVLGFPTKGLREAPGSGNDSPKAGGRRQAVHYDRPLSRRESRQAGMGVGGNSTGLRGVFVFFCLHRLWVVAGVLSHGGCFQWSKRLALLSRRGHFGPYQVLAQAVMTIGGGGERGRERVSKAQHRYVLRKL